MYHQTKSFHVYHTNTEAPLTGNKIRQKRKRIRERKEERGKKKLEKPEEQKMELENPERFQGSFCIECDYLKDQKDPLMFLFVLKPLKTKQVRFPLFFSLLSIWKTFFSTVSQRYFCIRRLAESKIEVTANIAS